MKPLFYSLSSMDWFERGLMTAKRGQLTTDVELCFFRKRNPDMQFMEIQCRQIIGQELLLYFRVGMDKRLDVEIDR